MRISGHKSKSSVQSGHGRKLKVYPAGLILLHCGLKIKLPKSNLGPPTVAQVVQRPADNGVVRNLLLMAIFEDQHSSGLVGDRLRRRRWRIGDLGRRRRVGWGSPLRRAGWCARGLWRRRPPPAWIGSDDGSVASAERVVVAAHRRSSLTAQSSICSSGQSPAKCIPIAVAWLNSGQSGEVRSK